MFCHAQYYHGGFSTQALVILLSSLRLFSPISSSLVRLCDQQFMTWHRNIWPDDLGISSQNVECHINSWHGAILWLHYVFYEYKYGHFCDLRGKWCLLWWGKLPSIQTSFSYTVVFFFCSGLTFGWIFCIHGIHVLSWKSDFSLCILSC